MNQNSIKPNFHENEVLIGDILINLFKSKKIIILSILFFTLVAIFYSFSLKPIYKSTVLIELGYFEMPNGNQELIESSNDLISQLKVTHIYKKSDDQYNGSILINSLEDKLIRLESTSSSAEQNENLLNKMIDYIDGRHSNLASLNINMQKDQIYGEINLIESEISYIKESIRDDLEAQISIIQDDLPILDQEISQLEQVIIEDSNNLDLLKGTSLEIVRAANSPTLEQTISLYKSQVNLLKRVRNNINAELKILSEKLDALEKNTFQSNSLFKLEETKKSGENYTSNYDELVKLNQKLNSDKLFKLNQELKIRINKLQMLMSHTLIKTRPAGNIIISTINPKIMQKIYSGFFIGLFAGVFLVLIINFFKKINAEIQRNP